VHDHFGKRDTQIKGTPPVILVGNPNVGKSVIFGLLTGRYAVVSNYPGTTVEISRGLAVWDHTLTVIDTPGVNGLTPLSEDERVTRDILLMERPAAVIQVADAKNLRRGLLLTLQLAELGLPLILDLNMLDEARERGIDIDHKGLAALLGVPVVATVATRRQGIEALIREVGHPHAASLQTRYDPTLEAAVERIAALLPQTHLSRRGLALMLLAGDETLKGWLHQHLSDEHASAIERLHRETQARYTEPLSYVISRQRLQLADAILAQVYHAERPPSASWLRALGHWSAHPVAGIPVLLLVLYLLYQFVGVFGAGTLVDWFEGTLFGLWINPTVTTMVRFIPIPFLQELLVGPYGLVTMALTYAIAIVLPIVTTFFLAFGVLEDSGYLPRLAIMTHRVFRVLGLNGKAVLPMILGLGCDTMATLTARILETRKERIIVTLLLALGVPCSAQLGVILGMLGGLGLQATLLWAGVVLGVILTVGWLSAQIVRGERSDFIVEIPPLRVPHLSNLVVKTLARMEWYLREAVPLFVLGTLLLFVLDKINALVWLENATAPLVRDWLGLPVQATQAFIVGFLRRDYGAAGLFALSEQGMLTPRQTLVSLVTMTLFVPCVANALIIWKERGARTAAAIIGFIFPFAFLVGGLLNLGLARLYG
jgi:ferrous iron transport protein B